MSTQKKKKKKKKKRRAKKLPAKENTEEKKVLNLNSIFNQQVEEQVRSYERMLRRMGTENEELRTKMKNISNEKKKNFEFEINSRVRVGQEMEKIRKELYEIKTKKEATEVKHKKRIADLEKELKKRKAIFQQVLKEKNSKLNFFVDDPFMHDPLESRKKIRDTHIEFAQKFQRQKENFDLKLNEREIKLKNRYEEMLRQGVSKNINYITKTTVQKNYKLNLDINNYKREFQLVLDHNEELKEINKHLEEKVRLQKCRMNKLRGRIVMAGKKTLNSSLVKEELSKKQLREIERLKKVVLAKSNEVIGLEDQVYELKKDIRSKNIQINNFHSQLRKSSGLSTEIHKFLNDVARDVKRKLGNLDLRKWNPRNGVPFTLGKLNTYEREAVLRYIIYKLNQKEETKHFSPLKQKKRYSLPPINVPKF